MLNNVFVCLFSRNYNYNRNRYYHQRKRYQSTNANSNRSNAQQRSSSGQVGPWWRWVHEPCDSSTSNSGNAPCQQHSAQPAEKSGSGNVQRQPTTENIQQQPDSLTNKLTETTSRIICNVLHGKDGADAYNSTNAVAVQSSAEHTAHASQASSSGQSKRPALLPSPRNTCGGSVKTAGNVAAASKVQPSKGNTQAPWLSPNSRAGLDAHASLVRMATAPRSRREQIELERILQEHTKKSAAAKDHLPELPPSADMTGMTSATNRSQATSGFVSEGADTFQFSFNRSAGAGSSSVADDVIVVGEVTANSNVRGVQESRSSLSDAAQSGTSSTAGADKSVKKTCNKNKSKIAKVPKAKVSAAKTAKSKVTKAQRKMKRKSKVPKGTRKSHNFVVSDRIQRPRNPLPVTGSAYSLAARPLPLQVPTQMDVSSLIGSLGLSPNLTQGLVGSQNVVLPPSSSMVSPLNTLLQMSLHEEEILVMQSQCSSEIEQIQNAMKKLDEELQKRIRLKEKVS